MTLKGEETCTASPAVTASEPPVPKGRPDVPGGGSRKSPTPGTAVAPGVSGAPRALSSLLSFCCQTSSVCFLPGVGLEALLAGVCCPFV